VALVRREMWRTVMAPNTPAHAPAFRDSGPHRVELSPRAVSSLLYSSIFPESAPLPHASHLLTGREMATRPKRDTELTGAPRPAPSLKRLSVAGLRQTFAFCGVLPRRPYSADLRPIFAPDRAYKRSWLR
jgi:hypothetical protein